MALKKILIANRGEIALRIIRACHELDIPTVAVYSKADRLSLHVRFSDEAICIGEANPRESYLNVTRIMAAAELTNADAIHPGYGFLAENAAFAELCGDHHLAFIGPTPAVIREMGDKSRAREIMKKAGVPIIPGSDGVVKDPETAEKIAGELGYPVILKAVAGGGGKGMRIVHEPKNIQNAFNTARNEAESSFGNGDLYIERFIRKPRHIEIQILGDMHGNVYALGERECSIQRRHQKLIEESPSTAVDPELRRRMQETAVRAAKAVNYTGAGTIEFLLDDKKNFYFMEMNTRIQVEHAITEMVMGMDLVKKQIQIADGYILPERLKDYKIRGHALECRVNAEDPANGFKPSPGTIEALHIPGGSGVRVDTHLYSGYTIPVNYDSLLAKIIVQGSSRESAIHRMVRVLEETVIEGIKTTIPFHRQVLYHPDFVNGTFDTDFLEHFHFNPNKE
ncbi:MAG: acetyl-CoA carboxylase biotin carboxylase subunit [Candidatus Marinimicrobia bacterium]|nr:acetyl-CoA carboxylase biotin carboxylase subunit [Candidatus Neomarinimicrobiota bacterium]